MSRPLRIEFEGAVYHVTSRGDRREPIFEDDVDREICLELVGEALMRFDASMLAWCLMGNHYHFVLQTRRANLSRLMRHINGVYTQRYNRRHGKVGHLFQGRFKAIIVQTDSYLTEVCRYVDLNPVRAGIVESQDAWAWSSYRGFIGLDLPRAWHDVEAVLKQFAAKRSVAAHRYAEFVSKGHNIRLWETALHGQIYLGDSQFAASMQSRLENDPGVNVPRTQKRPVRKSLMEYLHEGDRDTGIAKAYLEGGYTQTSIAEATGLSVSRVSRLIAGMSVAKGRT
jgi:putative transposase